jgi:hypothetical protein
MAGATPQERQEMERAEASLLAQMEAAERTAAKTRGGWYLTDADKSLLKNVADERIRFNTWRGAWKQWAFTGRNAQTGDAYPVSFWLRIGKDIASALKAYSQGLFDQTAFAYVELVKEDVKKKAETIATPSLWPTWAKVLAGVAVAGAVVLTINNVAAIARTVRGAS